MDLVIECQIELYVTAILRTVDEMKEQVKVVEQLVKTIEELMGDNG